MHSAWRISIFGHVRRLHGSVPAHEALRPVVNSRAGHRPDDRPAWKRPRGRSRQTWIRQLEIDVGLTADAAWPVIVTCGGRNDPSSGPVSDECLSVRLCVCNAVYCDVQGWCRGVKVVPDNFLLTSLDTFAVGCIVYSQNATKKTNQRNYFSVWNTTKNARGTVCERKVLPVKTS